MLKLMFRQFKVVLLASARQSMHILRISIPAQPRSKSFKLLLSPTNSVKEEKFLTEPRLTPESLNLINVVLA